VNTALDSREVGVRNFLTERLLSSQEVLCSMEPVDDTSVHTCMCRSYNLQAQFPKFPLVYALCRADVTLALWVQFVLETIRRVRWC
jgi:hypothetical protein